MNIKDLLREQEYVKENGRIANNEYQESNNVSRQTATISLSDLLEKVIFIRIGKAGRGITYELPKLTNDNNVNLLVNTKVRKNENQEKE